MVQIEAFAVEQVSTSFSINTFIPHLYKGPGLIGEQWMDEWQPKCKYDIAETCCSSISIDQLQELSEDKSATVLQSGKKLDYGEIRGSNELRSNLARLYSSKGGM
jgi:hypothetical protein